MEKHRMYITEDAAISPYLNTHYWNGHTLGQGKTVMPPLPTQFRPTHAQTRSTLAAYDAYVARGSSSFPLQTFGTGEVIDAQDQLPGAIFVLQKEALEGRYVTVTQNNNWSGIPIKPLPATGTVRDITVLHMHYETSPHLAVVAPAAGRRPQRLTYIPADLHGAGLSRHLQMHKSAHIEPSPTVIGEIAHYMRRPGMDFYKEVIERTTGAIMVAAGTAERQQPSLFFLGRLAARPISD